jgi:CheY-like chemotaxis protein
VTPRLLLADDDVSIVALVRRYFESRGFEVVACLEPRQALAEIESGAAFDAVVCDLHFTGARLAEGLTIVERARALRPELSIVLFTGATTAGLPAQAARAGADALLTKPIALASLHEAVARAMKTP